MYKWASCQFCIPAVFFWLECKHQGGWQPAIYSLGEFSQGTWLQVITSACQNTVAKMNLFSEAKTNK